MSTFAVIDTETNWQDEVMSLGAIVADAADFRPLDSRYFVFEKEALRGGMYSAALHICRGEILCSRKEGMDELKKWFEAHQVSRVFAYNAVFDARHTPELSGYRWFDIMRLAAYRQYNPKIPHDADCCATGRLKRGFGVEEITRLLTGRRSYIETHNALYDAADELRIMKLLGYGIEKYDGCAI